MLVNFQTSQCKVFVSRTNGAVPSDVLHLVYAYTHVICNSKGIC